jgi:hypothetical protein
VIRGPIAGCHLGLHAIMFDALLSNTREDLLRTSQDTKASNQVPPTSCPNRWFLIIFKVLHLALQAHVLRSRLISNASTFLHFEPSHDTTYSTKISQTRCLKLRFSMLLLVLYFCFGHTCSTFVIVPRTCSYLRDARKVSCVLAVPPRPHCTTKAPLR